MLGEGGLSSPWGSWSQQPLVGHGTHAPWRGGYIQGYSRAVWNTEQTELEGTAEVFRETHVWRCSVNRAGRVAPGPKGSRGAAMGEAAQDLASTTAQQPRGLGEWKAQPETPEITVALSLESWGLWVLEGAASFSARRR